MASAAYRAGEKLHSEYYGEDSDYTNKGGVIYTEIFLPPHAPREYADRETLWNAVEKAEKGKKAQLAYSFDISFQNEFTQEENIALARQFLTEHFVSRGMVVDFAVHEPEKEEGGINNPHFHFLCPIRPIEQNGKWGLKQKREYVLDENGKTVTGADIFAMVAMLESLGVSALGVNCSLGAEQLKKYIPAIIKASSCPVIVNPNAGMPAISDGKTYYKQDANDFAAHMKEIADMGARILGGCCGTTPAHIKAITSALNGATPKEINIKNDTVVSSYSHACYFKEKVILIGERINPTGKSRLKTALRENDIDYLLKEAINQEEKGADMLDVNVGLPEIDEEAVLCQAIKEIQAITTLPLQIDTSNPKALESALRIYNGKALINSVNGKKESMETVFPIVKKYRGVVIALTLDENGIPNSARERANIAKRIVEKASEYGIDKKDIIVDPLCLTVSSDKNAPRITLDAIDIIKNELGIKTSLGISNVSFGLPNRDIINSVFFACALEKGLDAVIMNPFSEAMQNVYYAHNALCGIDESCQEYILYASQNGKKRKKELTKTNICFILNKNRCLRSADKKTNF